MSLINDVTEAIAKLPPEALELVERIIAGALKADDPVDYLKRRAEAEGAHAVAEAAVREALG